MQVSIKENILIIMPTTSLFGLDDSLLQTLSILSPFEIKGKGKNQAEGRSPDVILSTDMLL